MIIVHSVPLSAKKFTENDLDISKKYINPDVYPGIYDADEVPIGIKYITRKLVNIDDFEIGMDEDIDNKLSNAKMFLTQDPREFGRGEKADEVFASVQAHGYKLDKIPMSVCRCPDGKDYIMNGRTRLEKLISAGFTNIIADYYTTDNLDAFNKMAQITNVREDPYSPHTKGDIIKHCNHAIHMGYLKREYQDIVARILEIAPTSFKPATINKMALVVQQGDGRTNSVLSFTEVTAKKWLKQNGYHDNDKNNGIYYKVISCSFYSKAITMAARYLMNDLKGLYVKELRLVLHTDTLDGADPEVSWKSKTDTFRNKYDNSLRDIEQAYFNRTESRTTIKLFAVIPAVQSLSETYNMDKLVMFHVGQLKDMSFSEIDTEDTLEAFLMD